MIIQVAQALGLRAESPRYSSLGQRPRVTVGPPNRGLKARAKVEPRTIRQRRSAPRQPEAVEEAKKLRPIRKGPLAAHGIRPLTLLLLAILIPPAFRVAIFL